MSLLTFFICLLFVSFANYELASPIIVGMVTPKVDIAFGTQNAVGVNEVNSLCQFYPEEPIVEITVK